MLDHHNQVLAEAYRRHPERFVKGLPKAGVVPSAVRINKLSAIVTLMGNESLN